jgi:hypothetical protein
MLVRRDLSYNGLSGTLPLSFASLTHVQNLCVGARELRAAAAAPTNAFAGI